MEDNSIVKDFYESNYDEHGRAGRETLEFARSKIIIARHLAGDAMEVADIGGATGAYSFWLAEMGHNVHLLDLAQNHIDAAVQNAHDSGVSLASYTCADARRLPYDNQSMDMVLLMGALYHLHSPQERLACLAEAHRVLRPGGLLICTVTCRYNLVISAMKYKLFDHYSREYIEETMRTGRHPKANFYAHTPDEILAELASARFE